jgi:uncharacterized Zn-finger protein
MSRTPHEANQLVQPNAENHYRVTAEDLPLSCPMPGMYLWNSHPKVYLPIEAEGTAKCPYCGSTYELDRAATG